MHSNICINIVSIFASIFVYSNICVHFVQNQKYDLFDVANNCQCREHFVIEKQTYTPPQCRCHHPPHHTQLLIHHHRQCPFQLQQLSSTRRPVPSCYKLPRSLLVGPNRPDDNDKIDNDNNQCSADDDYDVDYCDDDDDYFDDDYDSKDHKSSHLRLEASDHAWAEGRTPGEKNCLFFSLYIIALTCKKIMYISLYTPPPTF